MIFFENQYFFQSHLILQSDLAMLPNFDDVSHVVECFKLGFVYQRRWPRPTTPLPATDSPLDLVDIEPQRSSRLLDLWINELCKKDFRHYKTITIGILCLVLLV